MNKIVLTLLAISALACAGCKEKPGTDAPHETTRTEAQQATASMPVQAQEPHPVAPSAVIPGGELRAGINEHEIPAGNGIKSKVSRIMNAGGYSYLEVAGKKGQKRWLALPEIKISVGDSIEFSETPPLVNFRSKTLNRTFDRISFVPGIRIIKKADE